LDARIRGCRESAYSIHQSSHSQLDWESRLCIYWVPACAGTTDFSFHVAKTAFCDARESGNPDRTRLDLRAGGDDELCLFDSMSMRYCLK
ncbi:MAG: hypothetical protein JXX14_26060, partial [Deltaproteobacteria bacterium]|nr:hypothetical protein [Deltaproteobacteria bacterium]